MHCEPAGERFVERQEWLLARELLCHCCRAKFVGITVQAAAVTRAVHSNHTQKENKTACFGYANVAFWHIRSQPQGCWLMSVAASDSIINNFLILFLEITSDDVMRHPQLLAAKQPEGFPIMVKQSGCYSMEGRVRSARCFLIIFTLSGCPPGECAVR